jgi:hypothetical protein
MEGFRMAPTDQRRKAMACDTPPDPGALAWLNEEIEHHRQVLAALLHERARELAAGGTR